MQLYADYQKFNPFRRPTWRWDRVLDLVDRMPVPGRCSRRDDDRVRQARGFTLHWRADGGSRRERLWWENPGLCYAFDLFEKAAEEPEPALCLEARLLARQGLNDVAYQLPTTVDAVAWYEALFFNVLDRLDNRDWITKHVLLPPLLGYYTPQHGGPRDPTVLAQQRDRGVVARPFLDASLKLFAYFGGSHAVDFFLSAFRHGKPLRSQDDMAGWLDEHWAMTKRRRSAQAMQTFEVNKYNVMELFQLHCKIIELDRSADAQESQRSDNERRLKTLLDEMPYCVGRGPEGHVPARLRGHDGDAAELRDDEVIQLGAGVDLVLPADLPKKLPPPRPKKQVDAESLQ